MMGTGHLRLHWVNDLRAPDGPCTVVIAGLGRVDVTVGDIRQANHTVTSEAWYYLDTVEGV